MALTEGLRRIKLIIKGILLTGAAFLAVAVSIALMEMLSINGPLSPFFLMIGAIGFYLFVLGGIISLITWVAEGFLLGRIPPK
jgi:hypothetical protein